MVRRCWSVCLLLGVLAACQSTTDRPGGSGPGGLDGDGLDPDGDGLVNADEARVGTDPQVADTDGDGIDDGEEMALGINPTLADSDGDGVDDGQELALGTDPASVDSDSDGFSDGEEVEAGTDPLDPFSWPYDGAVWPDNSAMADAVYGTGWEAGDTMPDFDMSDQLGEVIRLYRFYGYVILLDFSAGWCGACRVTAADAQVAWEVDREAGFLIVHVLIEDDGGGPPTSVFVDSWTKEYGIEFPVVRDLTRLAYDNLRFADVYPGSLPFLVLLDRDMRIDSGYGAGQEALIQQRTAQLLQNDLPVVPDTSGDSATGPDICDRDGDGALSFSCGGDDCNDDDAAMAPSVPELCDAVDHSCDGRIHVDAEDPTTFYLDADGDGFGDPAETMAGCAPWWPWVDNDADCDDSNAKLSPATLWYLDADGDGLGDPAQSTKACEAPAGYVDNGQDSDDDDPGSLGCWQQVRVGRDHSCALRVDGAIRCWGSNAQGQSNAPSGEGFTQIASGYKHACALGSDGAVACWGIGAGADAPSGTFLEISCGLNFCCGLTALDGDNASCWGDDSYGQSSPPPGTFLTVSAGGGRHACGILAESQELVCWGSSDGFQGGPDPTNAPAGAYTSLSSGHYFGCAVAADQTAACWGADKHGQTAAPSSTFSAVGAGTVHSCGLTTAGALECWGSDTLDRTNCPAGSYKQFDVNQLHSCAVGLDGLVKCWGHGGDFDTLTPASCGD